MMTLMRLPRWFIAAMVSGLVIRVAILAFTGSLGTPIVDEQHYRQLAGSLNAGHGFAFEAGTLTSLRPPLYPALLAAVFWATGPDNLQAVRVAQFLLSLGTVAVVYALGRRTLGAKAAQIAAAIVWLYPSLVMFNFLILTETLYTFLLSGFLLLLVSLIQSPTSGRAVSTGIALGLACLTRSVLWPLPLVLCPLTVFTLNGFWLRRLAIAGLLATGFVAVVGPWAVRNTRVQGVVTIVDTMGGMNLRMGNYEYTPDDRMWDAVSLSGEENWAYDLGLEFPGRRFTEGEKEKWAQRKALTYMRTHPGTTLRRAVIKFEDFWGLEREFVAAIRQRLYAPPPWFSVTAAAAILLSYPLVVVFGSAGMWLATARDWRLMVILLLPVIAIAAAHTIVFGHSRYHVPLVPIFALFAGALGAEGRRVWTTAGPAQRAGAVLTVSTLAAIWMHQILVSDWNRIRSLF